MAATRMNVLADVDLRRWLKDKRALAKSDGGGLTFTMSAAGTASWVLRYRSEGRQVELHVGALPRCHACGRQKTSCQKRVEVQQGRDPAAEKRKAKSRINIRELVVDYREMVLPTLAKSTQVSYGRNLKRIKTGLGAAKVGEVAKLLMWLV